jgi:hypothetical protein
MPEPLPGPAPTPEPNQLETESPAPSAGPTPDAALGPQPEDPDAKPNDGRSAAPSPAPTDGARHAIGRPIFRIDGGLDPSVAAPVIDPAVLGGGVLPGVAPRATQIAGPIDLMGGVVSAAVTQIGYFVRPEAAVAVATEFTFPLALALVVLLYLIAQDQVDRRDPKLRVAPQHAAETFIRFESEDGS